MTTFRIWVGVLASMGLVTIAVRLLIWQWRPHTRPCKWFGHDRRYVAIRLTGCVPLTAPDSNGRPFTCNHNHKIGETGITIARWVCRRCPEMQEECFGRGKDWKIDHERVVPDVKKWANWSQEPVPPDNSAARQKLEEIQKRILGKYLCGACNTEHERDPEKCPKVTLKIELAKDKIPCSTCGWCHQNGPCTPGLRYCDRCKAEHTGSCPVL